ncbi:MAG: NTF2 fold immunity protein [Eubacterium sp.]
MEKSKEMSGLVPYAVFYDTQDEIWIVNFRNPNSEKMIGGDCNIALQKKDGKVLRVWFGE